MGNFTEEELKAFLESDAAKSIIAENTKAALAETTAQYDEKLRTLSEEKERLALESMSEQERTQHELNKYKEKIAEQERLITKKALESRANQLITQFQLPEEAMELIASDDEITLTKRATLLSRLMSNVTKKQQQFSSFNQLATEINPWSKDQFNLTEQGRMFRENPQKARQMAAEHGFKI